MAVINENTRMLMRQLNRNAPDTDTCGISCGLEEADVDDSGLAERLAGGSLLLLSSSLRLVWDSKRWVFFNVTNLKCYRKTDEEQTAGKRLAA